MTVTVSELYDNWAKELADEIDAQVLADVFAQDGWNKVSLDTHTAGGVLMIELWLNEQGIYFQRFRNHYLFKSAEDATIFRLKWL